MLHLCAGLKLLAAADVISLSSSLSVAEACPQVQRRPQACRSAFDALDAQQGHHDPTMASGLQ
eukprot:295634-Rhodomonas_salina.1